MQLWNEYEGRIVADQFPLIKLLEPEGRSAFFSTTSTGTPAVLRLIEAHYDEPEILSRWEAVSRIDQPNLIKINKFGQTTLDETALLYAVMESSDASLADILKDRPLTAKETAEVASSLVPALAALHANQLVHEHIEAANVLAIGEVVKLRSDCIREAPEGAEGDESRARDVRDLATVLLQALTQRTNLPLGTTLPAPFHEIVTNGISGAWSLPQIAAALAPPSSPKRPAAPAPTTSAAKLTTYVPEAVSLPDRRSTPSTTPTPAAAPDEPRRITPWTTIAAALILALFIGWHFLHKSPAAVTTLATMPSEPAVAAAGVPSEAKPSNTANVGNTSTSASKSAGSSTGLSAGSRTQWRVVAYTYNHENQAQEKVDTIAKQHSSLNPEVFAPRGRAPYLVTVGGAMDRDQALAFRKKARATGLPRDTYAQNFPAATR